MFLHFLFCVIVLKEEKEKERKREACESICGKKKKCPQDTHFLHQLKYKQTFQNSNLSLPNV